MRALFSSTSLLPKLLLSAAGSIKAPLHSGHPNKRLAIHPWWFMRLHQPGPDLACSEEARD